MRRGKAAAMMAGQSLTAKAAQPVLSRPWAAAPSLGKRGGQRTFGDCLMR
jgi:hypothetical protein